MNVDLNNFEEVKKIVETAEENKKNLRRVIRALRNLKPEETIYRTHFDGNLTGDAIQKLNEEIKAVKPCKKVLNIINNTNEHEENENENKEITNENVVLYLLEKGCTYRDLYMDASTDVEVAANILNVGHGTVLKNFLLTLKPRKLATVATQVFFYEAIEPTLLDILYEFVNKDETNFYDAMSTVILEEKYDLLLYYVDKFLDIVSLPVNDNQEAWDFIAFAICSNGKKDLLKKFFRKNIRVPFNEYLGKDERLFDAFTISFYNGRKDLCKILLKNGYEIKENFVPIFSPDVSERVKEQMKNFNF